MNQKVVLITGATDGIGKALAKKMVSENFSICFIGRNESKVRTFEKDLRLINSQVNILGIVADLTLLKDTKRACQIFLENFDTLHVLILNANSIANDRIITSEGNEQNFALGYLSRVLMIEQLLPVLKITNKSQILSVIGLDVDRLDFDDLTIKTNFTGRKGLTRWQWAINLYTHHFNTIENVPMNLYMPGLVRTKILKNEPQPMRLFVQIMNKIMGLTPEQAADNLFYVIQQIEDNNLSDCTFSYRKRRNPIKLHMEKNDLENLLKVNSELFR